MYGIRCSDLYTEFGILVGILYSVFCILNAEFGILNAVDFLGTKNGGVDETRTRGLRRDRAAL